MERFSNFLSEGIAGRLFVYGVSSLKQKKQPILHFSVISIFTEIGALNFVRTFVIFSPFPEKMRRKGRFWTFPSLEQNVLQATTHPSTLGIVGLPSTRGTTGQETGLLDVGLPTEEPQDESTHVFSSNNV